MKTCEIRDSLGTRAVILPEKGATVISLTRGETEFLYCDRENLKSPERPRCGIPFLFPIFGRLKDGVYHRDGKEYPMQIHGFGHTSAWQVTEQAEDRLTVQLCADETTLAQYPFRFRVELCFRLENGSLHIRQRYENTDTIPMPFSYGFHPYFRVEELSNARVEANARVHIDFAAGKPQPFGHGSVGVSIPAGALEAGTAFAGVQSPAVLHLEPEGRRIELEFGPDFTQLVLWTQAGKPFLCVEPINGTPDGLNTGNHDTLAPGQIREAELILHTQLT